MKTRKLLKRFVLVLCFCMAISVTVLAEEKDVDELTYVSNEQTDSDEDLLKAASTSAHAAIYPDPTMYDATYSNNTKINLLFNVRTFGNEMERYEIRIFKGDTEDASKLVARKNADFEVTKGTYNITYVWDVTDYNKYTEGVYTISCTSFYNNEKNGDTVNNKETFKVKLEDYRRILDRKFVERLYNKVFQRSADAAGLEDWTNKLYNGTTTGATTAWNFFNSVEFTNKNTSDDQYVELLYQALFDRASDKEGKEGWINKLNDGMSRNYILKGFTDSAEFANLCSTYSIKQGTVNLSENRDRNPQVTAFVNRLYSIALNRTADVSGLNDWTGKLLDKVQTPKQVAYGFVFSQEMTNRNLTNEQFVTMLYHTMMDREPDESGLNDWVTKLKSGISRQKVYDGFADSVEFNNIVRSYGL